MTPGALRELAFLLAGLAVVGVSLTSRPPDAALLATGVGLLGATPAVGSRKKD
jgi:hypothetical protein